MVLVQFFRGKENVRALVIWDRIEAELGERKKLSLCTGPQEQGIGLGRVFLAVSLSHIHCAYR